MKVDDEVFKQAFECAFGTPKDLDILAIVKEFYVTSKYPDDAAQIIDAYCMLNRYATLINHKESNHGQNQSQ